MKTLFLAILGATVLTSSAMAGPRFGGFVTFGGGFCGPRFFAAPVCYAPRVAYCAPVAYCAAPVYSYFNAPVIYGPIIYAPVARPVYRAPLFARAIQVSTVPFGWRR